MKILKDKKENVLTLEDRHKIVLQELEFDELNIEGVRDFSEIWKIFLEREIDDGWIQTFEKQILEMLQVYWGRKAFIDIDRKNKKIECYGPDGRKVTI